VKPPSFGTGNYFSDHPSTCAKHIPRLAIQDHYPDRQVDVELFDGNNNNEQNKPTSNEVEGKQAPSIEPIAPNPTESSVAGDTCPSAIDQICVVSLDGG
jgi:hypothetical protein